MSIKVRSWPILSLLAILLIAGSAAVTYSFVRHQSSNVNPINKSSVSTSPAPAADSNPSQQTKTSPSGVTNPTTSTTSPTNPKSPTTASAPFSVQIVNASMTSSTNLHVGTLVSNTTTGQCVLSASQNGGSPITLATSTVKEDVNEYDCGVYNVSTSKFPSSGQWLLTLTVTSNGASANAQRTVTIS